MHRNQRHVTVRTIDRETFPRAHTTPRLDATTAKAENPRGDYSHSRTLSPQWATELRRPPIGGRAPGEDEPSERSRNTSSCTAHLVQPCATTGRHYRWGRRTNGGRAGRAAPRLRPSPPPLASSPHRGSDGFDGVPQLASSRANHVSVCTELEMEAG